jgi:hypothetical protein
MKPCGSSRRRLLNILGSLGLGRDLEGVFSLFSIFAGFLRDLEAHLDRMSFRCNISAQTPIPS